MNNELIERARGLAQAATPGPWMITVPEIEVGYTHGAIIWGEAVADEKPGWVKDGINIGEMAPSDNDDYPITHANHSNGLFVAASRELVPALCDALEAAQVENARIKMDVKSLEIANRESMNMLIERDDEIKRLKSETYCAYCGERFELDNGSAALVSEHIRTCVKHPMRAVEVENSRLREALERFAKIDLTGPVGNEIAWDILNARAALEPRP